MTRLALLDLSALFWRAWHASEGDASATIARVVDDTAGAAYQYGRVIVCLDSPGNFRHGMTAHLPPNRRYKANRPEKDPLAFRALEASVEKLRASGYALAKADGCEADDVIASLVAQLAPTDECYILSEDKDLYALIGPRVSQVTRHGVTGPAECEAKFGVKPFQIRDLLAICGDAADNIAGCPGIGAGKAAAILQACGTLAAAQQTPVARLAAIPGVSEALAHGFVAWDARLAVDLVTLRDNCEVSLEDLLRAPTPKKQTLGSRMVASRIDNATTEGQQRPMAIDKEALRARMQAARTQAAETEPEPELETETEDNAPEAAEAPKRKPRPTPPKTKVTAGSVVRTLTDLVRELAAAEKETAKAQAAESKIREQIANAALA